MVDAGLVPFSKPTWLIRDLLEDGKEMELDTEKLGIKDVMEEVDRHSRLLNRQAELAGS